MSCVNEFAPQLRTRGFRATPQRTVILHVLRHTGGHLAPSQVYERARVDLPGLTEPTVYRTLDFLAENGFVLAAHTGNSRTVYELAEANHHHLVCRVCGVVADVDCAVGETPCLEPSDLAGFAVDEAEVVFWGICADCQKSAVTA